MKKMANYIFGILGRGRVGDMFGPDCDFYLFGNDEECLFSKSVENF